MEEGELLEVRVAVGDSVKSGDVLFDVATDKIDMEVESPADGVVAEIIGQTGSMMAVGAPVMKLFTETQVMSFDFNTPTPESSPAIEEIAPPVPITVPSLLSNAEVVLNEITIKAVPKARKVAQERGIDLRTVKATGLFGMITNEDVTQMKGGEQNNPRRDANRKIVAKAYESTRSIPQLTLSRYVALVSTKREGDLARLVAAWAKVLRKNSDVNISTLTGQTHSEIGIALVMESKYGLALPVFTNPDMLTQDELTELIVKTENQARNGRVPIDMLNGATASIFDLSRTNISSAQPLLMPSHTTAITLGSSNGVVNSAELSITVDLRYCDSLEAADLLDQLASSI